MKNKFYINRMSLFKVLYLFLLLYFCYDSNVNVLRYPSCSIYVTIFLTIILLLYSFINGSFYFNPKCFIVMCFFMIFTIVSGLVYRTNFNNLIYFIIIYIIMFIVSCCFCKKEFINCFIYAVFLSCCCALITEFLLYPIYKNGIIIANKFYIDNHLWPRIDLFLSFCVPPISGIRRMFGFFREPGIFQIFIVLAFSFVMFFSNDIKYKKIIVLFLLISLFLTFSSTAFLCIILILFACFFNSKFKHKFKFIMLIFLFVFLFIYFIKVNDNLYDAFARMLIKFVDNTNNESFSVRYYSVFNVIKASFNNPLFGLGWDNGLNFIINNYNQFGTRDVTGTTLIIASVYGWPMCILCNYLLYKLLREQLKNNFIVLFLIFIAIFLSINTQNILQNVFIWLIFALPLFSERMKKYE